MQNMGKFSFTPYAQYADHLTDFHETQNCSWYMGTNLHGVISLKMALIISQHRNWNIMARNKSSVSRFGKNRLNMNTVSFCVHAYVILIGRYTYTHTHTHTHTKFCMTARNIAVIQMGQLSA